MKRLVVHIGMGKAASSTIQGSLLQDCESFSTFHRNINEVKSIDDLWWRGLLQRSKNSSDPIHRIEKEFENKSLVVISDEIISGHMDLIRNTLLNLTELKGIKIDILLITRIQEHLLESAFDQSMRTRVNMLEGPNINRLKTDRLVYKGNAAQWIDDLLTSHNMGESNIIDVLKYADMYSLFEGLGSNMSLHILPLELMRSDSDEFCRRLGLLINLEPGRIQKLMLEARNVRGGRITDFHGGHFLTRLLKGSKFTEYLKRTGIKDSQIASLLSVVLPLKKTTRFPNTVRQRIRDTFKDSNRRLNERLDLDLESLGYL